MTSKDFGMQQPPTYTELRNEASPPIHELVAEHNRMLQEMAAAGQAEDESFRRTMARWYERDRQKGGASWE